MSAPRDAGAIGELKASAGELTARLIIAGLEDARRSADVVGPGTFMTSATGELATCALVSCATGDEAARSSIAHTGPTPPLRPLSLSRA